MSNFISEQAMCSECCLLACNISGNCGCTLCRKCQARQGGALGQHENCRSCNCSACSKVLEFQRNGDRLQLNDPPLSSPASPRKGFSRNRLSQLAELQQFSENHQLCSICRSDEEEDGDDSQRHFLSPTSEFAQDVSHLDSVSISDSQELYSYNSVNSSPWDSPSILPDISNTSPGSSKVAYSDQEDQIYLRDPVADAVDGYYMCDSLSPYLSHVDKKAQQPLDFERNGLIWYPPPPEDENYNELFGYDVDEYDDIEDSGTNFSSSSFSDDIFPIGEKPSGSLKEHLRTTVRRHFTALVLQLLKDEKIHTSRESWLEVVSSLAWQAASFVKPDIRKGGSMDPSHYVKVKCITSGNLSDSSLIKGIVFTKNVKHKRMVSQHKSPRLLLLGGSLEYQRVSSKLASINTVMEEESNNLKIAVSKIEAYRPNVLLVEKSVSPYAQEYLLDKGISLVLNVKRSILERICRCTGAQLVPSIDHIASAQLGQCEVFWVEKVLAASALVTHPSKRSVKTLMYFEGCPRRLGCTVILRGAILEELKKVKRVVSLAIFAAYHLLLQTSFLVDEGATLPKPTMNPASSAPENLVNSITNASMSECPTTRQEISKEHNKDVVYDKHGLHRFLTCSEAPYKTDCNLPIESNQGDHGDVVNPRLTDGLCSLYRGSCLEESQNIPSGGQYKETSSPKHFPRTGRFCVKGHYNSLGEHTNLVLNAADDPTRRHDALEVSEEYFSPNDNQSILVSLSSTCIPKGAVCERSQLLRIKFYGSFDRPLGSYLLDDLFDQTSSCRSCNEPAEVHSRCYTHQQGSLTITVRRLTSMKLPGEQDGKIWIWHRCLKCQHRDGIPPATRRVVLSDAAWGLSFGKFLELCFSNHATANRLASCGHSLQKDCLRFYGWGNMVALFRYSPLDILSVYLPPLIIDFSGYKMQEWLRSEAISIMSSLNSLHLEVRNIIQKLELKIAKSVSEPIKETIHKHILQLKDVLERESDEYSVLLKPASAENNQPSEGYDDILELNRLKRGLLIDSILWDHRLCLLDSLSKSKSSTAKVHPQVPGESTSTSQTQVFSESVFNDDELYNRLEESTVRSWTFSDNWSSTSPEEFSMQAVEMNLSTLSGEVCVGSAGLGVVSGQCLGEHIEQVRCEGNTDALSSESLSSSVSTLYDRIDSAWTGSCQSLTQQLNGNAETGSVGQHSLMNRRHYRKLVSPVRVSSFDSALRFRNNLHQRLSPLSLQLSSVKSFGASEAYLGSESNPITRQAYIKRCVSIKRLNFLASHKSVFISSFSCVACEAARLLIPQGGPVDVVIALYDNEPTSIIAYAVCSQEHANFIDCKADQREAAYEGQNVTIAVSRTSTSQVHSDDIRPWSYGSDDLKPFNGGSNANQKELHFKFSYVDYYSIPGDKVKFSVICYFAKQFDALRRKCCPNNLDFIRSLSRCKKWNAQGGKSNVYFAKSWDERFIVKQVTRTELESFEDFAPEYFNYLTESINSGSPTCLAKVLGIYQVTVKHFKGGREMKMDLMVMENLLYERNVSRVYDLKGSSWARYNADTSGNNKVLLDLNLLESLRTKQIFLSSRAKRKFERAIWNDTSFLASIDVMDYSLLVGVDESKKELVIGIIDYMRQYTWDKHLETWVKASGILGGPKNASPTVISPLQYKKRFRKAMSKYFPTVPDQWSS